MRVVAAATHAATVPPTPAERVTAVGAGMAAMLRRFGMPFMSRPTGLYTPNAAKESPVPASGSPHGVTAIADRVIAEGRKRVVVVSPEGDRASAATVRLLRELADRGRRVVLVDMTAQGAMGLAMLEGVRQPGITELLCGERRFSEVIHPDRFSDAHVIPLGEADPETAMRSADRLPLILDALETVYDFLIIECGPSSAAQIRRVAEDRAFVIISILDPDHADVVQAALDLDQNGYEDVVILLDDQPGTDRHPRT